MSTQSEIRPLHQWLPLYICIQTHGCQNCLANTHLIRIIQLPDQNIINHLIWSTTSSRTYLTPWIVCSVPDLCMCSDTLFSDVNIRLTLWKIWREGMCSKTATLSLCPWTQEVLVWCTEVRFDTLTMYEGHIHL